MINSRSLDELLEPVRERAIKLLALCEARNIELLVTSTYRDFECQDRLYAQGRFLPGKVVTWAKAGDSWHNWRRAFDIVPMRNGKCVWGTRGHDGELWRTIGGLGEQCGLEWGGSWARHPDYPHFQDKMGRTLYGLKKEAGLIK